MRPGAGGDAPLRTRTAPLTLLRDIAPLACILTIGLALRLRHFGHVLSFDEALNAITAADLALGKWDDPFFGMFYRHPPLYLGLAALLARLLGSVEMALKGLSLASSMATVGVMFLLMRRSVDRRAGLLAALAFAIMPVTGVFDTWAKQDPLAVLFAALFVHSFLRQRYPVAGIFLGLGLLTKETLLFVLLAAALYTLRTFTARKLRGLLRATATGALICCGWYLFFSITVVDFLNFFVGKSPVNLWFSQPWYYYLGRLPTDLSWPVLVFLLVAVALRAKRTPDALASDGDSPDPTTTEDAVLLCLFWFATTLSFLSLSRGKPVWMAHTHAFPAAALAGYGMRRLLGASTFGTPVATAIVSIGVAFTLLIGASLDHERYIEESGSNLDTMAEYRLASEANRNLEPGEVLVLTEHDVTPTLMYYLEAYAPDSIRTLPLVDETGLPLKEAAVGRTAGKTIYLLDKSISLSLLGSYMKRLDPCLLLVKRSADGTIGLAEQLSPMPGGTRIERAVLYHSRELLGEGRARMGR